MTIETLAVRFQKSMGQPILIGADYVYSMYQMPITAGRQLLRISRKSARESPLQGMRLKIGDGDLLVNGQNLPDVVLWADSSPEEVQVLISANKDTVLKIWNVWSIAGTMHAWIGNAGMLVDRTGDDALFRCSDGVGEVDFSALIVSATLLGSV
ncbi:hypothetical protein [Ralstonia pseudosolanacearum]|uniref:hypothetical protein n=1 Tax=Ralstonia pseudosolanacearum TaxID=1310165 RepID=UPI004053DF64